MSKEHIFELSGQNRHNKKQKKANSTTEKHTKKHNNKTAITTNIFCCRKKKNKIGKKNTVGKSEVQGIKLSNSKLKHGSEIGAGKDSKRTNKHSQNCDEQQQEKKTTLFLHETKEVEQEKAQKKTDITGKINLNFLPTACNFCVTTKQGRRLCIAAIATRHDTNQDVASPGNLPTNS